MYLLLHNCCIATLGASENICEAYLNGSQEIKLELEKKYGQKEVKKLVAEHCSEQWLEENSKRCPHCFVPVEVC